MMSTVFLWVAFNVFILGMLALDLGVFHRKAHSVGTKEAAVWTAIWIASALIFNVAIYLLRGPQPALEFFTAYLIEKALSVDNIFVFLVIFTYFDVPAAYQHRVLFWGILGALIMRAIFIGTGLALLKYFHWVIYAFGALLIFTGIKMLTQKETAVHPEKNPVLRLLRRYMPITERFEGQRFFVLQQGRRFATPLLIVLGVVESTDLMFAVDSIPAVLAISHDPFIVYTSNVFAILGLRALYFLLAGVLGLFYYLRYGLGLVLAFVGLKMLITDLYKIPISISLAVIAAILAASVVASLIRNRIVNRVPIPTEEATGSS